MKTASNQTEEEEELKGKNKTGSKSVGKSLKDVIKRVGSGLLNASSHSQGDDDWDGRRFAVGGLPLRLRRKSAPDLFNRAAATEVVAIDLMNASIYLDETTWSVDDYDSLHHSTEDLFISPVTSKSKLVRTSSPRSNLIMDSKKKTYIQAAQVTLCPELDDGARPKARKGDDDTPNNANNIGNDKDEQSLAGGRTYKKSKKKAKMRGSKKSTVEMADIERIVVEDADAKESDNLATRDDKANRSLIGGSSHRKSKKKSKRRNSPKAALDQNDEEDCVVKDIARNDICRARDEGEKHDQSLAGESAHSKRGEQSMSQTSLRSNLGCVDDGNEAPLKPDGSNRVGRKKSKKKSKRDTESDGEEEGNAKSKVSNKAGKFKSKNKLARDVDISCEFELLKLRDQSAERLSTKKKGKKAKRQKSTGTLKVLDAFDPDREVSAETKGYSTLSEDESSIESFDKIYDGSLGTRKISLSMSSQQLKENAYMVEDIETLQKDLMKERQALQKEREAIAFECERSQFHLQQEADEKEDLRRKIVALEHQVREERLAADADEMAMMEDEEIMSALVVENENLEKRVQELIAADKDNPVSSQEKTGHSLRSHLHVFPPSGNVEQMQAELRQAMIEISDRDVTIHEQNEKMAVLERELAYWKSGPRVEGDGTQMKKRGSQDKVELVTAQLETTVDYQSRLIESLMAQMSDLKTENRGASTNGSERNDTFSTRSRPQRRQSLSDDLCLNDSSSDVRRDPFRRRFSSANNLYGRF